MNITKYSKVKNTSIKASVKIARQINRHLFKNFIETRIFELFNVTFGSKLETFTEFWTIFIIYYLYQLVRLLYLSVNM